MDQEAIFTLIKKNIALILPHLSLHALTIEDSLRQLGANSIDRMEIIILTMQDLKVKVPLLEFGKASNIGELIEIFSQHSSSQSLST